LSSRVTEVVAPFRTTLAQALEGGKAMKRLAAFLLAGVAVLLAAPNPAWSEQRAERFVLKTNDPTASTGRVIAAGPITGVGTFVLEGQGPEPFAGKFILPGGTVFVMVAPDPSSTNFDPRTCLLRLTTSGTITITGGTGAFSGASGGGRSAGRAIVRFSRDARGDCQLEEKPVFFTGVVEITAVVGN